MRRTQVRTLPGVIIELRTFDRSGIVERVPSLLISALACRHDQPVVARLGAEEITARKQQKTIYPTKSGGRHMLP